MLAAKCAFHGVPGRDPALGACKFLQNAYEADLIGRKMDEGSRPGKAAGLAMMSQKGDPGLSSVVSGEIVQRTHFPGGRDPMLPLIPPWRWPLDAGEVQRQMCVGMK